MTEQELQEFKARVQEAMYHGFGVAKAEEYVEELAEEGASKSPPKDVEALSPAHLLAMIEQVEKHHGGKAEHKAEAKAEAKAAKKSESKAPPPKKEEKKAEAKEEKKTHEHHDSADFSSVLADLGKDEKK